MRLTANAHESSGRREKSVETGLSGAFGEISEHSDNHEVTGLDPVGPIGAGTIP